MGASARTICDTLIIPPASREQFLPLDSPAGSLLREHQISLAGISDLTAGYEIGRSDPRFHVLLYCIAGTARFETTRERRTLVRGQLLVLPAHTTYRYYVRQGRWSILWVHLSVRRIWSRLENRPWEVRTHHEGAAILHAAENLLRESGEKDELSARVAQLNAELILLHLRREVTISADPKTRQMDELLLSLWREVDRQLARPWTVRDLARAAHMSVSHFHRVLSSTHGVSPMEKVTQLRMNRACILLRSAADTVASIAARVGYENPFAFSVAFKRSVGMSPSEYRARYGEKAEITAKSAKGREP
jgi:AraC-like DNA-binding protein